VTAKTKDGKEIFKTQKIYMPQATNCRGDEMKYGAQFKMGLIRDTSLQPLQTKVEQFEITFHMKMWKKRPANQRSVK